MRRVLLQRALAGAQRRAAAPATTFSAQARRAASTSSSAPAPGGPEALADAPKNEPIRDYSAPDSKQRRELERALEELGAQVQDVPIVIDGKEYRTGEARQQRVPFEHARPLAQFYYGTHELIRLAADVAVARRRDWEHVGLEARAQLFERAAELASNKWRARLNAATMLGQAKTAKQAEIDAAAELADFFRFNSYFARKLAQWQPRSTEFERNSSELRGADGFVAAISPFNFTAIGANLVNAPALMGNCVVWKPSDTAVLSNYLVLKLLQEAGLPDGVVNFVPCAGLDFGRLITADRRLAGVNFTGSLTTFQWLWSEVGLNVKRYDSFPRLVGECGGKNFHLVHPSAHVDAAVAQTLRSAFEYSGQKCSACSRLYVPAGLWSGAGGMRDKLVALAKTLKVGPATDISNTFTSAVIDAAAFARITEYQAYARAIGQDEVRLLCGGQADDTTGYYVEPTILETRNPRNRLMLEEIFGPVLSVFVYQENELDKTLELIDENQFALTGAIFAQDELFLERARRRLRMAAGNLYLNDKSTGAVVGQQPFGGARQSGTNDKAGGPFNLLRWANQQTVKRTTRHLTDIL